MVGEEPEVRMLPGPASVMRMRADLSGMGYTAEEFSIAGLAHSCAGAGPRSAHYNTRAIVFRPSDPARYSGTALVEWLNCRDGVDTVPQWLRMHRHMVRRGMVWIGVSAQRAGVEGGEGSGAASHLKAFDPARYGDLHHPGDGFSFDIFRQASRVVRAGALSVAAPRCLLGVGSSQSARYLTTFVNAMDRADRTFDGFLLTGRHRSAATLEGASLCGGRVPLRHDLGVPVMVLQSETDLFGRMQSYDVRQSEAANVRLWEVAGTAHADSYIIRVGKMDDGTADPAALAAAYFVEPNGRLPLAQRMNASPAYHYVHQAALHHLERWAQAGIPPPRAPWLAASEARRIERDGLGLSLGGLRTPWVDRPAWVHSGENREDGAFEGLFGSTLPLPPNVLERLYPGGAEDYAAQFASALGSAIEGGFLLAEDADEILQLARAHYELAAACRPGAGATCRAG